MTDDFLKLRFVKGKDMANGMRNTSGTPLNDEEIAFVKSEISRIQADETVFVFNDKEHLKKSTCYNITKDKIFVTRNVFPDEKYASAHPRDTMSVRAVLAHEYYGHRQYRDEYQSDLAKGDNYRTTPEWKDECRASLRAAHDTPGLTACDRRDLVLDAIYRAKEYGQIMEWDDFMKETVYGYGKDERKITKPFRFPKCVADESKNRTQPSGFHERQMPKMREKSKDDDFGER